IPKALGALTELWILQLHNNKLTGYVPKELGALENLHELTLENNRLTGAIPAELGNLHALQGFTFGNTGGLKGLLRFGNKLTGGPAEGEGLDSWKARIRGDIDHQEEDDDVPAFESVPSSRVSFMGRWQAQTGEDDEIKQDASVPLSTPNQRQEEAEVDRSFRAQLSSSAGLDSLIRENPEALQDIQ
ncbi:unnamed protein product, partial [Ectocarpus fasciculatus]